MNTNHPILVVKTLLSPLLRLCFSVAAALLLCNTTLHADFETFTSRADFNVAAPGLPIENFENLTNPVAATGVDLIGDVVNSETLKNPISPGDLLPGFSVTTERLATSPESLALLNEAAGYPTTLSNLIGPIQGEDELVLDFSPGVSAVGFDMWGLVGESNTGESYLDAVFYKNQFIIGSMRVDANYTARFIGGVATGGDFITRVVLENQQDAMGGDDLGEFIDNLAFGEPGSVVSLPCDFDADGDCDPTDLDLLYDNFGDATFDMDGDGQTDGNDVRAFLVAASQPSNPFNPSGRTFVLGDVNFSGGVDSTDLGLLLNNFGKPGEFKFGDGNFNDDGEVNSSDLGLLLNNFGAASASAVPEPSSLLVMLLILAVFGWRRRR